MFSSFFPFFFFSFWIFCFFFGESSILFTFFCSKKKLLVFFTILILASFFSHPFLITFSLSPCQTFPFSSIFFHGIHFCPLRKNFHLSILSPLSQFFSLLVPQSLVFRIFFSPSSLFHFSLRFSFLPFFFISPLSISCFLISFFLSPFFWIWILDLSTHQS